MMKKQLFAALVGAGSLLSLAAEEMVFKPEDFRYEDGKSKINASADGVVTLKHMCHVWIKKPVETVPGKTYTISVDYRADKKALPVTTAYILLDEKGKKIDSREYFIIPDSQTVLVKATEMDDTQIVVKSQPKWKRNPYRGRTVAFNVKEDLSDLPNPQVSSNVKEFRNEGENIVVTLAKPVMAELPAGTAVRLHEQGGFYCPVDKANVWIFPTPEWQTVKFSFTIPDKVKQFLPAVIYYDPKGENPIQFRNYKLTIE